MITTLGTVCEAYMMSLLADPTYFTIMPGNVYEVYMRSLPADPYLVTRHPGLDLVPPLTNDLDAGGHPDVFQEARAFLAGLLHVPRQLRGGQRQAVKQPRQVDQPEICKPGNQSGTQRESNTKTFE